jgi:hypothetical protein
MSRTAPIGKSSSSQDVFSAAFDEVLDRDTAARDKKNHGLIAQKLSEEDNHKITEALTALKFKKRIPAGFGYYYSGVPESVLKSLFLGSDQDKEIGWQVSGNSSYAFFCEADGRTRSFVLPRQAKNVAFGLNVPENEVRAFIAAHELAHKLTLHNFGLSRLPWKNELFTSNWGKVVVTRESAVLFTRTQ